MATYSRADDFKASGPVYLRIVDWNNEHHRRSVAASLVYGVYTLEQERQAKRRGRRALATPWWEFFHFQLIKELVDNNDGSVFGAIYKFKPKLAPEDGTKRHPYHVIAFRGTLLEPDSGLGDLELDLRIILNQLHRTSRTEIALQAVRDTVSKGSNVWLAGHSLGAAIAMVAGKTMAMAGTFLECYLFNPPYCSVPIERIFKDQKLKQVIQIAGTVIKAVLALAMSDKFPQQQQITLSMDCLFTALTTWMPYIFVHPDDYICSGYIGYFETSKGMEQLGLVDIARFSAQHSFGVLLLTALGEKEDPGAHLLPSASLTVNMCPARDLQQAHSLQQWWRQDLHQTLKNQIYQYGND